MDKSNENKCNCGDVELHRKLYQLEQSFLDFYEGYQESLKPHLFCFAIQSALVRLALHSAPNAKEALKLLEEGSKAGLNAYMEDIVDGEAKEI